MSQSAGLSKRPSGAGQTNGPPMVVVSPGAGVVTIGRVVSKMSSPVDLISC